MHIHLMCWFFKPSVQRSTRTPFCSAVAGSFLCDRKRVHLSKLLPNAYFPYKKFSLVRKDQKELDLKATAEITREQVHTRSLLSDSGVIEVRIFCNVCAHWSEHSFTVNAGPGFVAFGEPLRERNTHHPHHVTGKVSCLSVRTYSSCTAGRKHCRCCRLCGSSAGSSIKLVNESWSIP